MNPHSHWMKSHIDKLVKSSSCIGVSCFTTETTKNPNHDQDLMIPSGRGRVVDLGGAGAGDAGPGPETRPGRVGGDGEGGQRGPDLQHHRVQRVPADDEQANKQRYRTEGSN